MGALTERGKLLQEQIYRGKTKRKGSSQFLKIVIRLWLYFLEQRTFTRDLWK